MFMLVNVKVKLYYILYSLVWHHFEITLSDNYYTFCILLVSTLFSYIILNFVDGNMISSIKKEISADWK